MFRHICSTEHSQQSTTRLHNETWNALLPDLFVKVLFGLSQSKFLLGSMQVLLQHIHGRQWRRSTFLATPEHHTGVAQLLAWFWDSPEKQHPFSLHNFVTGGRREG